MKSFRSILDVAWVAAPKALGGLAMVVLNVSLLSWFTPEFFGIYALCLTAMVLLSEGMFGAAIDLAVLRLAPLHLAQAKDAQALCVEQAALRLKVQVMAGVSLLLCLGSVPISRLMLQRNDSAHLLFMVCLASMMALVLGSALLHLQIRSRFSHYGVLDFTHTAFKYGGIALVLYVCHQTAWPLSPGMVLMWFAIAPGLAIVLFLLMNSKQLSSRQRSSGPEDRALARAELIKQAGWILATLLVSALANKLDVFLMATLTTMEQVGIFTGGQTIANIPLLLGSYLGIVLNPKVMPYFHAGKLFRLMRDVQIMLWLACAAGYGLVVCFYGPIKELILPERFAASGDVILTLLPMTLAGMTSYPLTLAFLLFVCPRLLIRMECWILPFTLCAYVWIVPHYGAWGAAVVTASAGVIKTVVAQWIALRWAFNGPGDLMATTKIDD